MEEQSVNLKDS